MTKRFGVTNKVGVGASASAVMGGGADIGGPEMKSIYRFECRDRAGALKWVEEVENLVVNAGLNDLLDKYFKGSGYTAGWHVGLIDNEDFGAIAAGDTAAKIVDTPGEINSPTTNDWCEWVGYDESTREVLTLGSVASQSVDNSASRAEFTISASGSINGAFVISNNTKGGTTGVLYGAASFGSPRSVEDDDTLRVTVTLTAAAA